ncbi:MAG: DUF2294 domain-containing protein [Gloeocapsa sp. UFS-A4-WI-NPMV-4B04]|jgi:uncharacterized protein YbcI|nr:DUF2294 domain-containing protein [Gloeocapsa sp. UFS-A4-WI-NPMV-4B04]
MLEGSQLTLRQLEHSISQRIMSLYVTHLGHQPQKVSCQLVDKTVTIMVEDSITLPEQLLNNSGQENLAKEVRSNIQKAVAIHLKSAIEEVYATTVIDIFSTCTFDTGQTSIVAILATVPEIVTNQQTELVGDNDG